MGGGEGDSSMKCPDVCVGGLPLITYAPRGGWVGSSLLYISIAYYMQKGGGWVQIAYVLNGRPLGGLKRYPL